MARESEMIRNGGGLIDVTLCDGFLYCASVFSKSIAKATFSFPYVLDLAFGALYHVYEVRRRAGDVMPYTFLLVSSEESVRRGSFFNKTARFTPFSVTTERSRCQGGGVVCGVWPWLVCRVGCCIGGRIWEEEKGMLLGNVVKSEEYWGCWKWLYVC